MVIYAKGMMVKMKPKLLLLLPILLAAACGAGPTTVPQPTIPVVTPTPFAPTLVPTLPIVAPTNPPLDCGPEAAITLAQTQSDLALAADSKVEAASQAGADSAALAQTGIAEFTLARDLMKAYQVPDCLLQGKVFADQFFGERIDAYTALAAGDQAAYETHLGNSEIARQNMIVVVNGVLGQ
jgi:hypothetical protein